MLAINRDCHPFLGLSPLPTLFAQNLGALGLGSQKVTNFIYFCKFRGVNFTGLGLIKVTNFIFILQM
ncbi:hypothetical protein, partial [Acidithiobacillus caldus]|uniref:hypothetical protein n=1 Tax=Acidithiobacillus caldus TaxID=33059 RepID=UPI001CF52A1C